MKFWREVLAVVLVSLFAVGPVWADEPKRDPFEKPALERHVTLNINPQNPRREVDWSTERLVVLGEESPIVELASNDPGYSSKTPLPAGTLVAVDVKTGEAKWVYICGNDILTRGFIPRGRIIFFEGPDFDRACEESMKALKQFMGEGFNQLGNQLLRMEGTVNEIHEGVQTLVERSTPLGPPQITLWVENQAGERVTKARKGTNLILRWSASNAKQCRVVITAPTQISDDDVFGVAGKMNYTLTADTKFIVKCEGPGGPAEESYLVKKSGRIWPWVLGAAIVIGTAVALSGGGDNKEKKPLPPTQPNGIPIIIGSPK